MKKSKKIYYILATCIVFGLFFLLLLVPIKTSGLILDKGQVITPDGQNQEVGFPFLLPLGSENRVTFQFHFSDTDGDTLVIRRPSGNALAVFLNGEQIYKLGDMENPSSNIWNSTLVIPLLDDLKSDNLLEIKLSGSSHDVGLSIPPYIEDYRTASNRTGLGRFLYHDLLNISIGAALITGLILIVSSISREPKYRGEFFLGLACLLAAFYCLDYTLRLTSGSLAMFLWLKKAMMVAGYLAALCFLIGMELYLTRRLGISKVMIYVTLASVLLIIAAGNMVVLAKMLNYLNVVLLINIAGTVIVIVQHQKQKLWMIIPAVLLTLSMIQMVMLTALNLSYPFVMQYVILVSAVAFGVSMINEYNQLYRENNELEQKANRDPLTGVYNRNILYKISPRSQDVLVIMDIDNLKLFNDRFGHPEGDRLLKSLMETVCSNLRQTDLVIRYGGDEFILILRDSTVEIVERVMQRIKNQFSQKKFVNWVSFSYGIEEVGETFSDTLVRADETLYSMKKESKGDSTPFDDNMTMGDDKSQI